MCQLIIHRPSLEEEGAEGNPGADLYSAPCQHPYARESITTPSGVHSMFAGLPIVKTSHLPYDPSHSSIRHINCSLINTTFTSIRKLPPSNGCILTLPRRFWTVPVRVAVALLCDFRARPLGTTRPMDALIAACDDPFDPLCDIMHGSTYSRTVYDPTSALTAAPRGTPTRQYICLLYTSPSPRD